MIQLHLLNHHPEFKGVAKSRIEAIMRTCERQATLDRKGQCPLCQESMPTLTQLRKHLGKHHEELSLFAVPSHLQGEYEDDASGDSKSSAISVRSAASINVDESAGIPDNSPSRVGLQDLYTSLTRSCEKGDIEAARRVLEIELYNIKSDKDPAGRNLLHLAAGQGSHELGKSYGEHCRFWELIMTQSRLASQARLESTFRRFEGKHSSNSRCLCSRDF